MKNINNDMLSIIIPLYNKSKYIEFNLESILNADIPIEYEIIVVDDKSTDNSIEIAKKYPVKLLINEKNMGVSYTRNKGVFESKGSIIAIVDADVVIKKDTFKKALEIYETDKNQVINAYWEEDSYNDGLFPRFHSMKQSYYMLRELKDKNKFVIISMGVFCLMKKSIFTETGGYNENFVKPGGEEYNFAYRISKKYPLNWYKDLTVYHNCRYFSEYYFDLYKRSMYFFYTINLAKKDKNYNLKQAQDFPEVYKMISVFLFFIFCFFTVLINVKFISFIIISLITFLYFNFNFFLFIVHKKSFIFALYCILIDFLLFIPKGIGFLLGFLKFTVLNKEIA